MVYALSLSSVAFFQDHDFPSLQGDNMLTIYWEKPKHPTYPSNLSSNLRIAPGQPPHPLLLQFASTRPRYTGPPFPQRCRGHDVRDTQILQQRAGLRKRREGRAEVLGRQPVPAVEAAVDVNDASRFPPSHRSSLPERERHTARTDGC